MSAAAPAETDLLAAALAYAGDGKPVFPCKPETKRPFMEGGFKTATTDPEQITAWWRKWPRAMIGMPTGPVSGVWVLDIDDPEVFEQAREALGLELPATRRCLTGKGLHYHFTFDPAQPVRNSQCKMDKGTGEKLWPFPSLHGAEVRGEGGYVILPPSLHPSGRRYEWSLEMVPAVAPGSLMQIVLKADAAPEPAKRVPVDRTPTSGDTPYGLKALEDECRAVAQAPNTAQEKTLNEAALKIGALCAGGQLTDGTARRHLIAAGLSMPSHNPRDPWTPQGITAKVERGMADGAQRPRGPKEGAIRRDSFTRTSAAQSAPPQDDDPGPQPDEYYSAEVYDLNTGEIPDNPPPLTPDIVDPVPIDLWARYEAPKLPSGMLPTAIELFAVRHGEVMGADPAGLAMAALTVCCAAITDDIAVQVKAYDPSWRESARIWVGLVGPPSRKKTPIMRVAVRPLARRDGVLMAHYMQEKEQYDSLPPKEQKLAAKPKLVRHIVADATTESLQEVLRHSTGGVLTEQDELSGWFGLMDKYAPGKGGQADRAFYLKAFNGGRYTLDRISRGSTQIPNLSISLLGGIQPEPLRKITSDSVDDGLVQRLLPVILGPSNVGTDAPAGNAVDAYERLVEKLLLLRPPEAQGLQPTYDNRPQPLKFSGEARTVRERLEREHLGLVQSLEATSPKLAAHFGKYDGIFARLCVAWHCIENCDKGPAVPAEISGRTATCVAEFMDSYIRPSAIAFYAGLLGLSDGHDLIQGLAAYIVAERVEYVNSRVVQRSTRALKSFTADEARQLCEKLEAFGWLDPTDPPTRSHTPRWRVVPAVHEMFAEKGRVEAERRRAARDALQSILGG
jgi:hypothetical protein